MASPVAVPLSLITIDNNNYIESEDSDWEEEDAALEGLTLTDTQSSLKTNTSADDDALVYEEQDLGAPLSQQQPSLQWEDTTFSTDQEEEIKVPIFNSESQGTDWDDDISVDEDEEVEEAPLEVEKGNSGAENAKLLPMEEVKTKFLGRMVTQAFSTSMFKATETAGTTVKDAENKTSPPAKKRQRKSTGAPLPRLQPKRHVCARSYSNASNSCSPEMNPTCNFTHKVNNIQGRHVLVTCSKCNKQITILVSFFLSIFHSFYYHCFYKSPIVSRNSPVFLFNCLSFYSV